MAPERRHTGRWPVGRWLRDERGASMVEFAIICPVLFALIFGVIDFGRALFLYNNLQDTARRASRLAAVQLPNPCADADRQRVVDSARVWIREFNNNPSSATATVNVTCSVDGFGRATRVSVEIPGYLFRSIVPVPALQNIRMTLRAGVRFEGANVGS